MLVMCYWIHNTRNIILQIQTVLLPIGIFHAIIAVLIITLYMLVRRRKKAGSSSLESYIDGLRSIIAGDNQTAFIKLRQAVDQDTENIDAYLRLGDLFREKGMVDRALQIHRELTLRRGVGPEIYKNINKSLAQDYLAAGAREKAIELLKPMTKDSDGSRLWAEEQLLDLFVKSEMWNDAEELYSGIMKRNKQKGSPRLANIKIMIGRELQEKGEYHKARVAYKEALTYDKNNPFAYMYIAESYKQEDRIEDAAEYLKKICQEVPRYAFMAFAAIEETLFELGRFREVESPGQWCRL